VDRHRFSKRARELAERAKRLEDLGKMPDRAVELDFRQAGEMMRGAAADIQELIEAKLPGCICRRIDHDDYSYLDYSLECRHHHQLHALTEKVKADYKKMEKVLKDEIRMKLVAAALSGAVRDDSNSTNAQLATDAIEIADEAIRRLTEVT
jgi:hypothetical protein